MWAIILHGGAKEIAPAEERAHREGCLAALEVGRAILASGGTSIDAVEMAIRQLESDPTFNAGYGSAQNSDGEVEMCAAIMEGADFNVGGVTVIKGVWHPISVARELLYEGPILLAAAGAERFATERGIERCDPHELIAERPAQAVRAAGHDTVGCVALDNSGNIAVGTSTGGLDGSPPGRVGDSPQPGCGFYVDNRLGGVAFSGDGEQIARKILASRVLNHLDSGTCDEALLGALQSVEAIGGEAGGIFLSPSGQFEWRHNSRDFAVAMVNSGMSEPASYTNRRQVNA